MSITINAIEERVHRMDNLWHVAADLVAADDLDGATEWALRARELGEELVEVVKDLLDTAHPPQESVEPAEPREVGSVGIKVAPSVKAQLDAKEQGARIRVTEFDGQLKEFDLDVRTGIYMKADTGRHWALQNKSALAEGAARYLFSHEITSFEEIN